MNLTVPIFMAVITSVDILRDKKNRFKDIVEISDTSRIKYYLSKIGVYMTIGFAMSFLLSFTLLFVRYFKYDMLEGIDYTLTECLWLVLVRWLAYSTPVLLTYISLSTCVTLVFNSAVSGIVVCIAYAFAKYPIFDLRMPGNFAFEYIYHLPRQISTYFYFWHNKARKEAIVPIELSNVIKSYMLIFAISFVLFAVGFVLYKRQKD